MRTKRAASALVAVLSVIAVLAAVVAAIAIRVQVEGLRVDATVAAQARRLAGMSAVTLATSLLAGPDDLGDPVLDTVREVTFGDVAVRFAISDQAGKLPLGYLYGSVEPSRRKEFAAAILDALEGPVLPAELPEADGLLSEPAAQQAKPADYACADDVSLRELLALLGHGAARPLFRVPGPDFEDNPGLGQLVRAGGPMRINVNTAPEAVLRLVMQAAGRQGDAPLLLAARRQKPFESLAELRDRHVMTDRAVDAIAHRLCTENGPRCVVAEATLEGTQEVFVGFLVQKEDRWTVRRFFSTDEPIVE